VHRWTPLFPPLLRGDETLGGPGLQTWGTDWLPLIAFPTSEEVGHPSVPPLRGCDPSAERQARARGDEETELGAAHEGRRYIGCV
jgi:hypothetical protein